MNERERPYLYRRDKHGKSVHRDYCARAGATSVEWRYAKGFTPKQIAEQIAQYPWLRACRLCKPDKGSS